MIKFFKRNYKEIVFAIVIIMCIFLIGSALLFANEYSKDLEEQAQIRVQGYSYDIKKSLNQSTDILKMNTLNMAEIIGECDDIYAVVNEFERLKQLSSYKDIITVRYVIDGKEYIESGDIFLEKEAEEVINVIGKDHAESLGVIYERVTNFQSVGVYAPTGSDKFVESIVVFYPVNRISGAFETLNTEEISKSRFLAFCSSNGTILELLNNDLSDVGTKNNVLEYLRTQINDKAVIDRINKIVVEGKSAVFHITFNGEAHVVSVIGTGDLGGGMSVIGLYKLSDVFESGYSTINVIMTTMIIVFVLMIFFSIYFIAGRFFVNREIYSAKAKNKTLGCYTEVGFKNEMAGILKRHSGTQFAVMKIEIKYFKYILENYGEETANGILRYICVVFDKEITSEELYGYSGDGKFCLLLHYRESEGLKERLNRIFLTANRYPTLREKNFSLKLKFGIYEIDKSVEENADQMLDNAHVALVSENQMASSFCYYTKDMRNTYLNKADIEVKAEPALENDEFVVFYQPKWDIVNDKIDGCEALVRWYDPEKEIYRNPATFLPLFESNGFINKIDRYVYQKVCENIVELINGGYSVYPVSVNVSRVTAIQPGFIDYYTEIKNKYRIPDKFITIEFTESFAYENYEMLNSVIKQLRNNGFLCSIDDFGSGYSSYNILKQIDVDEIKLDKFFIDPGASRERDTLILKSVIEAVNAMGVKVTQEGVENIEDVELLKRLKCKVIQGYYFSKPLMLVDYIAFTSKHGGRK